MKRNLAAVMVAAVLLGGGASAALAADCSVYTSVNGGGSAPANSSVLNTTNVKLNGVDSDDCAGHYALGDSALATSVTVANANTLFGHTDWLGAAKVDSNSSEFGVFSGLKFELVSVIGLGQTTGSFTLQVTDTNGLAPANLPATLDLAIMLSKGAGINDFYFFNDEVVNASNAGTFTVGFTNPNGNSLQELSHINVLVRDIRSGPSCPTGDPTCSPQQIPEPGTIVLVGLALLGLSRAARRRTLQ